MSCLLRALIALIVVSTLTTSSPANTISSDDATRILALSKKIGQIYKDLLEIGMSILRSRSANDLSANQEAWRAYYCMNRLDQRVEIMERNIYGVMVAAEMSSALTDPFDERLTLEVVKITLSTASSILMTDRSEINAVMGGSARQSQLLYDQAKSLMRLVEETERINTPILRRVEADIKAPIKLPAR